MATTKRRRPKGTGSVRQRGSNYSVIWVDADGHRREKTIGPSKEAAQTALKQLVADASAGRRSRQTGYPFGLFVRTWLGQHTASASTIETSYRPIVENHLLPAFEDDDLQQMDVRLVNEYVRAKLSGDTVPPVRGLARQKLAPNSVRNHLSLLHAIFESARDQGIVTGANPVTKANKPKSRTEEVVPLSKRESEALVAEVPEAYRMLTQLLINLGLRIGEALALRIEDWDSPTQRLHVRRTLKRGPGGAHTTGPPKTRAGVRTIQASDAFAGALDRHIASLSGKTNPNGLLFPSSGGLYLSGDNFRNRIIQPAATRAGIARHINVHTLRHTAASLYIAAGVDVVRLAAFLGHGDTSTTLDIYAHLFNAHHLAAKDVIDLVG